MSPTLHNSEYDDYVFVAFFGGREPIPDLNIGALVNNGRDRAGISHLDTVAAQRVRGDETMCGIPNALNELRCEASRTAPPGSAHTVPTSSHRWLAAHPVAPEG